MTTGVTPLAGGVGHGRAHDLSDKDIPIALQLRVHCPGLYHLGLLLTILVWKQIPGSFLNTFIK